MSIDWTRKRYWLVGASEGLGRAVAGVMSRAGADLVLSARNAGRLDELAAELPGRAQAVPLDVSDRAAVEAAAAEIGDIDGMVYLAGVYWPLGAQAWDNAKNETMADINYTGAMRTVGAVLPRMLERGQGHIVLTGSLSGFRGLPGAVAYGSSNAAVMYMAEAVQADSEEAAAMGISGTPAFLINGVLLSGAQPLEAFEQVIDRELERAGN